MCFAKLSLEKHPWKNKKIEKNNHGYLEKNVKNKSRILFNNSVE